MCAVSFTFCNKPTVVSSTLCLSALNTKVTKTAQVAFFLPLIFCISKIIMSYPLGIADYTLQQIYMI